jgi:excinuclease UvrABC nuclease subunit
MTQELLPVGLRRFDVPFLSCEANCKVSGVYFLISGAGAIEYVGQSSDLFMRLRSHFGYYGKSVNGREWMEAFYTPVAQHRLLSTEAQFIHDLKPPANRRIPSLETIASFRRTEDISRRFVASLKSIDR